MITLFWSEDGNRAVFGRPNAMAACMYGLMRFGYRPEEQDTPDWALKPLNLDRAELRDWLTSVDLQAAPWIDTRPVAHYFVQLDDDQAFGFRMRFL